MTTLSDQIKRRGIFQVEATPDEILNQVTQLRELDQCAEGKQGIGTIAIVLGIPLIGFGIFGMAGAGSPLAAIPLVLGVMAIVGGIIYRVIAGKLNLADRRYELLANTIETLRRDMASTAKMQAFVSFRSPTDNTKFQRKGEIGPWKVSFYSDAWFRLNGRFLDNTAFQLEVTELTQKRGRWKRSRSGKNKYKQKIKTATVANLRLKAKPHKYPNLDTYAPQVAASAVLPAWCELKQCNATADSISMKIGTKQTWEVPRSGGKKTRFHGGQMVSMMFLSLYRILNICKGSGSTT